ncbi:MAG: ribonuclease HIII [Candidatus Altiarchaeota archaeon]
MNRIGTDESGKGDYFGPLVVAAVYVGDDEAKLKKLGVKDSKKLSDPKALELAEEIKKSSPYDIVRINPEKYNKLHEKFGNLNILLAWAHARAIENLLAKVEAKKVISDQFGDEKYLKEKLMKKGKKVELIQMHRAESDTAVAAASVVARAAFLDSLAYLSRTYGIQFPKGATHVEHQGRMFIAAYGQERLKEVAKVHFKTTQRIMPGSARDGSSPLQKS